MIVRWIALKEAKRFIRLHHRHAPKLTGGIVAIGLFVSGQLRGVAVVGRGARLDAPESATITRLCTDGCRNGCSKLYSKAKRLAQALGFTGKIKTFTRIDEAGSSLFAVGALEDGVTREQHWSRPSRPRSTDEATSKRRWRLE